MNKIYDEDDGKMAIAAEQQDWDEVRCLLDAGENPHDHRVSDGMNCLSPLYFALEAKNFAMAEMLYLAGDRLDDLRVENGMLSFLALYMAHGYNMFVDKNKTLSRCVSGGLAAQALSLLEKQAQEQAELDRAAAAIPDCFYMRCRSEGSLVCKLLGKLLELGADISNCKEDLLKRMEISRSWPKVLRRTVDWDSLETVCNLIKNA